MIDESSAFPFDRVPPHSDDAEICLLASMMLDAGVRAECRTLINGSDFYNTDNQIIFDVLVSMDRQQKPVDALILREELIRRQLWADVGGKPYLARILDTVPVAAHGPYYAGIVREKSMLRRLISNANELIRQAYTPATNDRAAELAQHAASEFGAISAGCESNLWTLEEILHQAIEARSNGTIKRLPSGMMALDSIIGGFAPGKMTIVGARPGMGKSVMVKQAAMNMAGGAMAPTGEVMPPVRVGVVAVEEDRDKIAENIIANASGIENNHIAFNTLDRMEWEEIAKAVGRVSGAPVYGTDTAFTLPAIEAEIVRMVAKHKIEVVFVDHIHIIDAMVNTNREQQVSHISRTLKTLFRRLNIHGVLMAQMNRGVGRVSGVGEIPKPVLSDLRDSGSLEADGDIVILLHREDWYKQNLPDFLPDRIVELVVAKNKSGRVGTAKMRFDAKTQSIVDLPLADTYASHGFSAAQTVA